MNTKNDPHQNTPEQKSNAEIPQDHTEKEHAWWRSVKYPDPPYESER